MLCGPILAGAGVPSIWEL